MSKLHQELDMVAESLERISRTLARVMEAMEQGGLTPMVDDYFQILIAQARVSEAKERLMKASLKH